MEELISLYDNALIYHPNVFLPVLFFLSILGIIFVSIGIIVFGRKVRRVAREVENNLKNKKRKTSFVKNIIVFLIRKKIFFTRIKKIFFTQTNTVLIRLNLQIEKIVKKVGKEILIDK